MKILLADAHPEVQSALRLILQHTPAITQVIEANNLVGLFACCAGECPDLVLFDLALAHPPRTGSLPLASLIGVFRRLCPKTRVVVMSSRFEAEQEALEAGAHGFISKTDAPDEVVSRILQFLDNRSEDIA